MDSPKPASVAGKVGGCGCTAEPQQYPALTQAEGLLAEGES